MGGVPAWVCSGMKPEKNCGEIVEVDLARRAVARRPLPPELFRQVLGGRGLGAALIAEWLLGRRHDSPADSPVIVAPGLLTGSPWPAAARYHVTFLSPLTGVYGYANAGGFFGGHLASCGISALVVRGVSEQPVYLVVQPGRIDIRPAGDLWGRTTGETEASLKQRLPGASVVSIGPAGENGVLFSSLMNDGGRAAARCGGGAVWGAKRLKAVAVVPGENRSFPEGFRAAARQAAEKVNACPGSAALRNWGTPFLVALKNVVGDLPTQNRRMVQFPWAERVDAHALQPYRVGRKGCQGCPIGCGRVSSVAGGRYRSRTSGPEYESVDALGPLCYCADPEAIIYANMLCNELGMDTISTGNVIAFAMECAEEGLLGREEGTLTWGDGGLMVALIRDIAYRRSLGAMLASGVRRAAVEVGLRSLRYAMEVKGMEIPCQDPRVAKGFALAHATANRGADHLYALPTMDGARLERAGRDLLPHAMPGLLDLEDTTHKPDMVKLGEDYCAVSDVLGVCKFTTTETYALYPADLASGLRGIGLSFHAEELLEVGERIVNLERMINGRLGLCSADDRLPQRFTEEEAVLESGETRALPLNVLQAMLRRYYSLRGWGENGLPLDATVRRLNLDGVTAR